MRILIVEDQVPIAIAMVRWCISQGHDARNACSGREAIRLLGSWWPDAAIMNFSLPDVSGVEIGLAIRHNPLDATDRVRMIALTEQPTPAELRLVRVAGFDHSLEKPIDYSELAQAIGSDPREKTRDERSMRREA